MVIEEDYSVPVRDMHISFADAPLQCDINDILEDIKRSQFTGWWYGYNTIARTVLDPLLTDWQKKDLAAAFGMDHLSNQFLPEEEDAAQSWVDAVKGVGAAFNTVVQWSSLPASPKPKAAMCMTIFYRHFEEVPDARDYPQYCDKLNTICGLYKVYTATENQTKDSTWWPKQSQWMNSGMYTGFWTPWNEAWYQTRLTKVALRAVYPISSNGERTKYLITEPQNTQMQPPLQQQGVVHRSTASTPTLSVDSKLPQEQLPTLASITMLRAASATSNSPRIALIKKGNSRCFSRWTSSQQSTSSTSPVIES
ncbi:hypothetical protein V8D89_016268 [Ganoderma adspersum]